MSTAIAASRDFVETEDHTDVLSPELVLVDPRLAEIARERLPERPMLFPVASRDHTGYAAAGSGAAAARLVAEGWTPDELADGYRRQTSWRLLAGVAATTVLALLLFDVRVQVGERPAAAERLVLQTESPESTINKPTAQEPVITPAARGSRSKPVRRRFAWGPTPGASSYHVEFFRGATRVFTDDIAGAALTVPVRWTHAGVKQTLRPGEYTWYVWPVISGRRATHASVQTTVSIPPG